jgi:hypothetical protein
MAGDFKPCSRCGGIFLAEYHGQEVCPFCSYHEPDRYIQIEADEPPEVPDEEDLVTSDHATFFIRGQEHKGPVVTVEPHEDWRREVKRFMIREQWYPNVWWISDHGNPHLLSLNE